jgi:hypothetical protein
MKYIEMPNIPEGPVHLAVVDGRIDQELELGLMKRGIRIIKTKKCKNVYDAISYHPDIMIHHLGGNRIIYAPGTDENFLKELQSYGFQLVSGSTVLQCNYPFDVAYNVARIGNFAFHNLKYTDTVLRNELDKEGVTCIDVKQGYSKCSISVVDKSSIITSDIGIFKAAEKEGIEALLIEPDENILLPGLISGFIGGSTAILDKNTWVTTGILSFLKSSKKISTFLQNKGVKFHSLSTHHIIDIGSIIPLTIK